MSSPQDDPQPPPEIRPEIEPVIELDCRGLPCPRPIIELAKAFAHLDVGDTVGVASDDSAAAVDVQAWCRMRGQEYAGSRIADDGVPVYLVRRLS